MEHLNGLPEEDDAPEGLLPTRPAGPSTWVSMGMLTLMLLTALVLG
jgi:hypothetical protein